MKSIADLANGIFRGLLLLNGGAMGAIFFALLALGFFIAGCGTALYAVSVADSPAPLLAATPKNKP